MVSVFARVLRLASIVICVIVAASFLVFAVNRTKTASAGQREALVTGASKGGSASGATGTGTTAKPHESDVRKALDETSKELTSPFDGIVSSSSGEWATRIVELLLTLFVYGFMLGYLARMVRVRA